MNNKDKVAERRIRLFEAKVFGEANSSIQVIEDLLNEKDTLSSEEVNK